MKTRMSMMLAAGLLAASVATAQNETYLVIDLTEGPRAKNYPVHYTNTPPDLNDDTCRTNKLWLRRIPAGTFMMGSPASELGRDAEREMQRQVTFTNDFYIGVFPVTQRQWALMLDNAPSTFRGDMRPVERVSYHTIRGAIYEHNTNWPTNGNRVRGDSLLGRMRQRTGLTFELPTEAQWEYACRAGTTTALNSGKDLTEIGACPNMTELGRYAFNLRDDKGKSNDAHTKVGMYQPNAWGLYDMHGNVWEWCLDWWQPDLGTDAITEPTGPATGTERVLRGGGWSNGARSCRSAYRISLEPNMASLYYGFRLCVLLTPVP